MSTLSAADVLGPEGMLAKLLPGYESRPQQLEMAAIVAEAIETGTHAVVEAPTGVGKSFAYLVPAILHALAHQKKVVISTGTIALQEQLVRKDIPLLRQLFPELKAVLVKGRQNYVSLRRLEHATTAQQAIFESREDASELADLVKWSGETQAGDLADLGYSPPAKVWRQVVSDRNNCHGRKCPRYSECYFYKARAEIEQADLLIVNHHLYFSDVSLRDEHAGILPKHDVVVFDEAHGLEDVATDHLGTTVSDAQVRFYLDGLWSRREKGLLANDVFGFAREAVNAARNAAEQFFHQVALLAGDGAEDTIPLAKNVVENVLSPALDALTVALTDCQGRAADDNVSTELRAQAQRSALLSGALRTVIEQPGDGFVYFAEVPKNRERGAISLNANPLSVADLLKELLFKAMKTVVLTSATLAADDSERFLFLRRRLGLEDGLAKRLGSPFDFARQAKLLINAAPLDPNSPRFEQALSLWLGDYLDAAQGGTFVLFTSYRQLDAVYQNVRGRLERSNRFVLKHGDGMGRTQMLDLFKRVGNAVLFGTASFWEGVDVQGDALKHVIITKLPFEVPNHPLVAARHREIERRGGNAFMERTVPEAILRLKQGFGRLIRTKTDTGSVVICDHRVLTKSYGRYFLRALPDCATETFRLDHYLTER